MVRVYEDYVDVKDTRTRQLKANLRVIIYLEDNGVTKAKAVKAVLSDNKSSGGSVSTSASARAR